MEVDLALLADAANLTQNRKLNILGIFDRFTLGPEFPSISPTFAIVVRIVAHPSEAGDHAVTLRLADEDGREIAKVEGGCTVTRKKASPKPLRVPIILQAQVNFPRPGDYVFDVLLDGRWEKSIPIEVQGRSS